MKRLVSLGLCFTVSLVLVFGPVLSHTDMNMALAVDMSDAPMTKDTITAGSDGDDDDQGDDDQEDDPVTQDTINEAESKDDNDEDNSGQSSDSNDNNDNKNEPTTTDTKATNKPNCPKGQERPLFEAACKPTNGQINDCGNDLDPINVGCQNTASQIQGDENAASLASEQAFMEDE
jgi:hypothetical protein